jgi:glycosyltransferase involved in cell wall biosynthesis
MEKVRVLNVCRTFDLEHLSGIQSVVRVFCRGFHRLGHSADILTTAAFGSRAYEERFENSTIYRRAYLYPTLHQGRGGTKTLDLFAGSPIAFNIRGVLERHELVLIHDVGSLGTQVARVCRRLGIRHLFFDHGSSPDFVPRSRIRQFLFFWRLVHGRFEEALRLSAGIFVDNRDMLETYRKITENAVGSLNPIDLEFFKGDRVHEVRKDAVDRGGVLRLLCVGRIDPQIDQLQLLDQLHDTRDVVVTFVGWSSDLQYYERFVAALKGSRHTLLQNVRAYTEELRGLYHGHDALIMPSRHQSQPLVPLEAMASGLVVVASNISGLNALVRHRENGFLYRDRSELMECLEAVRYDKELVATVRRNGLAYVQKFAVEAVCRKILESAAGLASRDPGALPPP